MAPIKTWNDENTETLRTLWARGLSCSEIAARIGGFSRNAIIGKATRLGLPGRMSGGKKGYGGRKSIHAGPKNDRKHIRNNVISARLRREAREFALDQAKKQQAGSETGIARKTLQELDSGDCRFIPGEPTGRCFCALPVFPGTSYCPAHFAITRAPGSAPNLPKKPEPARETTPVRADA